MGQLATLALVCAVLAASANAANPYTSNVINLTPKNFKQLKNSYVSPWVCVAVQQILILYITIAPHSFVALFTGRTSGSSTCAASDEDTARCFNRNGKSWQPS